MIAIIWFRNDLRLNDNPALGAALRAGLTLLPVYIHAPEEEGAWAPGAASAAWRRRSLAALDEDLRRRGTRLRFFVGPSAETLHSLARAVNAKAVFWNRRYEPAIEERDARIKRELRSTGIRADSFNGSLLFEPWELQTLGGDPYRVFTPFWRAALARWQVPSATTAPAALAAIEDAPNGVELDALGLAPSPAWDESFWKLWIPGESGALRSLDRFAQDASRQYREARDFPGNAGTSRMSPHLHFGEIAPWRIVQMLASAVGADNQENVASYERQLGWREFAHYVMHHFPRTPDENFNRRFNGFRWTDLSAKTMSAWQHGRTGVPIIDAGMRELWTTGWMHNRVRMIVASFLTKNLRAHWSHGARWFWDTLVDADLANNTLGWQWVAGTGVDAAPYVRVFNPVLQSKRFDREGEYIARWLPEIAALPAALRHEPWLDKALLAKVAPHYPRMPLIDLAASRSAALQAYRG